MLMSLSAARWRSFLLPLLLFSGVLALYIYTAPQGMVMDAGLSTDSAEMQRVTNRLGIAHSTGYPLYTMLGFVAARVGESVGQSPYTWVSYFSALMGALAVVLLYFVLGRVANSPVALAGSLAFAVINAVWHLSTVAEVQAMQMAIVLAILWLALLYLEQPNQIKYLLALAFVVGLGFANHRLTVLYLPGIGLALLAIRVWRYVRWQHILLAIILFALPLTSYAYLYIRANDAFVVHYTRPTWQPVNLTPQYVSNLISGSFTDGQSLEGNLSLLNAATFIPRFEFILGRVAADMTLFALLLGGVGLLFMFIRDWKRAVVLALPGAAAWGVLMAWDADAKSTIYQFHIYIAVVIGCAVALSGHYLPAKGWLNGRKMPVWAAIAALPLLLLVGYLISHNLPARNMRDNRQYEAFLHDLERVPENALIIAQSWSQEIFATLEYQDIHQQRNPAVIGAAFSHELIAPAQDPNGTIYIVDRAWRTRLGLDAGATGFMTDNGLALSGTYTRTFFQARPVDDPRVKKEADAATRINLVVNPDIEIYSYTLSVTDEQIDIGIFWHALTQPMQAYPTYVHLRAYDEMCVFKDDGVRLLAQDDAPAPVRGMYPTHIWAADHIVKDTYQLSLAGSTEPREKLAVVVGMTDIAGQRGNELCLRLPSVNE
jgi:hypothetical protein